MIRAAAPGAGAPIRTGLVAALLLAVSACQQSAMPGGNAMASADGAAASVPGAAPTPSPAEAIFCPEIQRRVSREDCDDLTSTAAMAEEGTAAFNVPPMTRGQSTTLQLAIGYAAPDGAVTGPAAPAGVVESQPGGTEEYSPVVGAHMRAELIGQAFRIEPLSPASQDLNPGSVTTWEWRVTPLKATDYGLTIKTAVEGIAADGNRYPLRSTVRNQPVEVSVTWAQRLGDTLDEAPTWLTRLTAVVTALAALAAAVWGLRRALKGRKA